MTVPSVDTETQVPPRRRRRWLPALLVTVAALAGVLVAFTWLRPHTYAGVVLQSPSPAPAMDGLSLHTGEPVDLDAYRGDVVLVYFGYTHCPDVCPTALSGIARAKELLGSRSEQVHTLMVTVDPARDTPRVLGEFVGHFDPRFLGVHGDEEAIAEVSALYGIYYSLGEPTAPGEYLVDHTATVMAIDPEGYLRVYYLDVPPEDLAADLEALLS